MNYNYFSEALGKRIHTKEDYLREMKVQGMVPKKEADQTVAEYKKNSHKPYKICKDTECLISGIKMHRPDKNGKIKLSDREIDKMKSMGVSFNPSFQPTGMKGGF